MKTMEHQKHFFFAVKIPDETKQIMKILCGKLKETLPFKSWVHHEDLHITLAFLGFAPADKIEKSAQNVLKAAAESNSFDLSIYKLGTFGKQDSPRIFFADTIESDELQLLRQHVFKACEQAGFELETRPFRPHITLARKWAGAEPFQKESLDLWKEIQPEPIQFKAASVALYQTNLQKSPKYEEVRLFSLE
jgi:RNA 2',3'-cyclic 3'-phosphodiesterase